MDGLPGNTASSLVIYLPYKWYSGKREGDVKVEVEGVGQYANHDARFSSLLSRKVAISNWYSLANSYTQK